MKGKLFSPFNIKNVTMKNRIVMSPMCMHSCTDHDGKVTDWHLIHYSTRAVGQVGTVMIEATAVSPEGRISYTDLGIWSDEHIAGLKRLIQMIHSQGAVAGIQLAHAGRKAKINEMTIAPSAIPYPDMKIPKEATDEDIKDIILEFKKATRRAREAGFDIIEIHAAHGYLINEFLSPLSNKRTDAYGGSFEKRYQFLREVIDSVKEEWENPIFVRISASEYVKEGNQPSHYVAYAKRMKSQGVDLIDCSSGSVVPANINVYPGYQVPYADQIKNEAGIATGAVGLIKTGFQAEEILQNNRADLIFIGRELLRNPYWVLEAAREINFEIEPPHQYSRGWQKQKEFTRL